jgi:hypothetical protein
MGKPHRALAAQLRPANYSQRRKAWLARNVESRRAFRRKWAGKPAPTRPCPPACELCEQPPGKRSLHLDHDHETGAFRGWLCSNCNSGLGLFRDNPRLLRKAAKYLVEQLV